MIRAPYSVANKIGTLLLTSSDGIGEASADWRNGKRAGL